MCEEVVPRGTVSGGISEKCSVDKHGLQGLEGDVAAMVGLVPKRHCLCYAKKVDCAPDQNADMENLMRCRLFIIHSLSQLIIS